MQNDLISRSALKTAYDRLPIQATIEIKCSDGVYRNRPVVDLALVCEMIENQPTAYNPEITVQQLKDIAKQLSKLYGVELLEDDVR